MKARDSGMPVEEMWREFFDPARILETLGSVNPEDDVVEFGCGYGTFSIEAARRTQGIVHALDIEPDMVALTATKAAGLGLRNLRAVRRDILAEGTGLADGSVGAALLFNILHAELPLDLLREAHRVLRPGGRVSVIHWIHDASTPRGPALAIRPRPEQCQAWLREAGFTELSPVASLPPYHYGLTAVKI